MTGWGLTCLPIVLWAGALYYFEGAYRLHLVVLSAAFHECGHLLAFSSLGIGTPHFRLEANGVRMVSPRMLSYGEEILVAMAGPLMNLLIWGVTFYTNQPWIQAFGEISLLTALYNLVPTGALDGERILSSLLSLCFGSLLSERVTAFLSYAVLFLALFSSLLGLFLGGDTLYGAVVWMAALFSQPFPNTKLEETGENERENEILRGFIGFSAQCRE